MKHLLHKHRTGSGLFRLCAYGLLCHVLSASSLQAQAQPALRTPDELAILYTTTVLYGLGTSAWLALQVKPDDVTGALVPFATLAPAGALIVAVGDSSHPLRHGIAHAIGAGLYLGFGEGLWLTGFQRAYAARHAGVERWGPQRVSSAIWLTSTAGGLVGAAIGALNRPTPGRVSFTASAAIWSGGLAALAAYAIEPSSRQREQMALAVGALAYNAGWVGGVLIGPLVAPSVMRARLVDLGGLFGTLLAGGGYALSVKDADPRATLGLAAVGGVLGLAITTWATSDMPADRSHDGLLPIFGQRRERQLTLSPLLVPTRGGFFAGLSGAL